MSHNYETIQGYLIYFVSFFFLRHICLYLYFVYCRELVEDLFGDVDLPEVDAKVKEEEPRSINQLKGDRKKKDADDPYDHHDDRKTAEKKPVWVDEDDDNIRYYGVL